MIEKRPATILLAAPLTLDRGSAHEDIVNIYSKARIVKTYEDILLANIYSFYNEIRLALRSDIGIRDEE